MAKQTHKLTRAAGTDRESRWTTPQNGTGQRDLGLCNTFSVSERGRWLGKASQGQTMMDKSVKLVAEAPRGEGAGQSRYKRKRTAV
jgi:hypothetical protein